jgi:outer membrane protein
MARLALRQFGGRKFALWVGFAIVVRFAAGACPLVSPAVAESLHEALGSAYAYNPRLDAQRAFLRATDEDVARAMSGYRPTIGGTADYGVKRDKTRPPSVLDGTTRPHGFRVEGAQPIFRGFQTYNAVNGAEANVRSEREIYRDVERSVLFDAVTAYMDVVRDKEVVRLAENNVNVLSRELKATQDRFSVGEVTRTDVAQAEARRADAVSNLDSARANLRTSRGAFLQVIGNPPSDLFDPGPPDQFLPGSLEEAINISNNENPLVVAALYREQAAGYAVKQIRGELLPTITLEASHEQSYDENKGTEKFGRSEVLGRITVPFYQAGAVYARVRQAKQNQIGRLQQIEQVRTEQAQAVVAAWAQLEAARAQLESDTISVESNRIALQGVREEEKVGQRTILDVLNAEQEYVQSQVDLERTKRNLVVAGYAVLSSMGRLDAAWIGVAAYVYDPQVHYQEVRRKWFGLSITHADGHQESFDANDSGYAQAK